MLRKERGKKDGNVKTSNVHEIQYYILNIHKCYLHTRFYIFIFERVNSKVDFTISRQKEL